MIDTRFSSSLPSYVVYELKTCEFCGRNFTREAGTRTKYCRECSAKQMAERKPVPITEERVAKRHPVPEPKMSQPRATAPRIDPAGELRAAWFKCAGEEMGP